MIVNLFDFEPPARSDGVKWNAWFLEEAPLEAGSWTQIDTAALTPLDADPRYPQPRDITSDNATAPQLWYRVRFRDTVGEFSEYSTPVQNVPIPWIPELRQVALHIMSRTVERDTNKFLGTFTDKTRPNDDQAWEAVRLAESDVIAVTGPLSKTGISADSWKAARSVVALRAAMLIERSYYPEQIGANKSPYPALERDWNAQVKQLAETVKEDLAGDIVPGDLEEAVPGGTVATDRDLIASSGQRIYSKTGAWIGSGTAVSTFPEDEGGMIGYGTQF